jgi:Phage-related terminase
LRGQRPGGAIIIFVMQRLAIDDPANWLLEREESRAEEKWHILAMDELHSAEPYWKGTGVYGFPKSCTMEPDPRKVGEVLAPKWRNRDEVERLQAQTGSVLSSAMRQQRPMRPTGDFWQEKWFKDRVYSMLPTDAFNGGWDWDTAYTKDEHNSGTAGVLSYRGVGDNESFKIYIQDILLDYLEFPELVTLMRSLKNAPHFVEKKASGKSIVQQLKTYNIRADEVLVLGDKLARASAVQPAAATGRIYISSLVYEKLMTGDQGLFRVTAEALQDGTVALDLNDAFVQGLHRHLGIGAIRKKKVSFG